MTQILQISKIILVVSRTLNSIYIICLFHYGHTRFQSFTQATNKEFPQIEHDKNM
jgi:hypothetical protein